MKTIIILLTIPALILAGELTINLDFARSDFRFDKSDGFDLVTMPRHSYTGELGKPLLPLANYTILLPPSAEVTGVEITSSIPTDLSGEYLIPPCRHYVPLLKDAPQPAPTAPDPDIYHSSVPYPQNIVSFTRSGCLSGYRLAAIQVAPLQYLPAQRKLVLHSNLKLKVSYIEGVHPPVAVTIGQRRLFSAEVAALIRNPEMIDHWAPQEAIVTSGTEVDMLVITTRILAPSFQPFADWKTRKGYRTKILTTDTVYACYTGADNQARIRNCIIDYWQNHGLKFVLLGGDAGLIPDRKGRITAEGITADIPADMYYADLEYSWDSNHNNRYGEMADSVDLYHDVYVGRVPADNAADVATFVHKDTMFEKHPDTTYLKKLLLPSEALFPPYHGRIANNLIADLFPSDWRISKLEDPGATAAPESLKRGYQFTHFCCHGNYDCFGNMLDISQVPSITSGNKLSIINAISCLTGRFDDQDCIAEALVNSGAGGALATLCNSRYGFGYPPALGPSELLDLAYYRLLNSGVHQLGMLNALSKDYYRGMSMNQEAWRWCIYALNLFGDPSLGVWTENPARLEVVHSDPIPTGPQVLRVQVTRAQQPVAGAQVCLMKDQDVYAVAQTNSLGRVDLFISPASTGTMNVTVTAPNCYPYESTCLVTSGSTQPAVVLSSVRVNDSFGNNNSRLDPGETAQLLITLSNRGNASVANLTGIVRTTNQFVRFPDSTDNYGTLNAGDSSSGAGYEVSVAPNAPAGTTAEFFISATGDEGSWQPSFTLPIGTRPDWRLWADHDTGNCILSATSLGSIGNIGPYNEGSGFKYPRDAANGSLCYASFVAGTGPSYIVDRFYGPPGGAINTDWRAVDSLRRATDIPDAQAYRAVFDDWHHPQAQGLAVEQKSISLKPSGYDDFVIFQYDLWNLGNDPISGLYAGIMSDFDVYNVQANNVRSDTTRNLTYMYDPSGSDPVYVGIQLLTPTTAANLSAIRNSVYVSPAGMMSEAVKDSFLRGTIRVRNSTSTTNWSIVVSAGPLNIPVSGYQRIAFAFVGGTSETSVKANSDSARLWYMRNIGVKESASAVPALPTPILSVNPTIARGPVRISYRLPQSAPAVLRVCDLSGRCVRQILFAPAQQGSVSLPTSHLPSGVYLLNLKTPAGTATTRLIVPTH